MMVLDKYYEAISTGVASSVSIKEPEHLYEPIKYILSIGGKRVRPALTLMTCDVLTGKYEEALPAALAVELFHNFSLMHDDIMDNAPLRRGQQSVHEKWDVNTAILSGDAMLILAYRFFENYDPVKFRDLSRLFSKTALLVCEGQQLDMDFEKREDVEIEEYLQMIENKTAVLLGAAMEMGAIVAGASEEEKSIMYEFGKNLGVAFQLQDDYLDVFGDPDSFGKQVGGDIMENKKTYLYLMVKELGTDVQIQEMMNLFSIQPDDPRQKIAAVRQIFIESGAGEATRLKSGEYSEKAFDLLSGMSISEGRKDLFRKFGTDLMNRRY